MDIIVFTIDFLDLFSAKVIREARARVSRPLLNGLLSSLIDLTDFMLYEKANSIVEGCNFLSEEALLCSRAVSPFIMFVSIYIGESGYHQCERLLVSGANPIISLHGSHEDGSRDLLTV